MDSLLFAVIVLYVLSTAGYLAFLFQQKEHLNLAGFYLLLIGFVLHTMFILFGFSTTGYLPVHNLGETLSIAGWAMAGLFALFQVKYKLKILGVFAAPLAAASIASPGPGR